jgi:hypothetical protein
MQSEIINLPIPTSQTNEGPIIHFASEKLFVDYDFEKEDKTVEWIRLVFEDVLTFEYKQDSSSTADDVKGYNKIVRFTESELLIKVKKEWENFVDPITKEKGFYYSHWLTFFDDKGSINVIAKNFNISLLDLVFRQK